MSQRSQTFPSESIADVAACEMPDKPRVLSHSTRTPPVPASPPASSPCIEDDSQINKKAVHESLIAGLSGLSLNRDHTPTYGWDMYGSPVDGPTRQNSRDSDGGDEGLAPRDSALPASVNMRPSTFGPVLSSPVHSPTHQDSKDSDGAGVGLAHRDSALSAPPNTRSSTFGPVRSAEGEVPALTLANVASESPSDIPQREESRT